MLKCVGTSNYIHAAILTDQNRINRDNTHQKTLHRVRAYLWNSKGNNPYCLSWSLVSPHWNKRTIIMHTQKYTRKKIHMLIDEIFHFNPTMESDFSCFDISDTLIDKISFKQPWYSIFLACLSSHLFHPIAIGVARTGSKHCMLHTVKSQAARCVLNFSIDMNRPNKIH